MRVWLAPHPRPAAIQINKYESSSGSLIGVLNLTIDNAPTNPNDKAKENFTTVITDNSHFHKLPQYVRIVFFWVQGYLWNELFTKLTRF